MLNILVIFLVAELILLGFIINFLIIIRHDRKHNIKQEDKEYTKSGNAQFFEAISDKEKFDQANSIDDLLK